MKLGHPKSLIELNHQTVINRQITLLGRTYPEAEIIVVAGYEADKLIRELPAAVKVIENERYEETNVVRSIGMALRIVPQDNDVLIVYGDLVFNTNTVKSLTQNGTAAVVDRKRQMDNDEVGVTIVDGKITQLTYGLQDKWAQIIFLEGKELALFKNVAWASASRKWYGFEAINRVIYHGGRIKAIEPKRMRIVEIDSPSSVAEARKIRG